MKHLTNFKLFESKDFSYKGVKVKKPDHISSNLVKELIDKGGDYGLTVQEILDIISTRIKKDT